MLKKYSFTIVLAFILILFTSAKWGNNPGNELINNMLAKINKFVSDYPQEKVYLHINKPSFISGDDLWFKAYVLNGTFHNFSLISNNLYVDLINSQGKIISHKLYWIERGVANGDFLLNDSLPSGIYQIRAYTNWMRNFGEDYFFRSDFQVLNLKSNKIGNGQNNASINKNDIDIQFFPEGGALVNNIRCRVAFKALNSKGHGIDVSGRILDNSGNEVEQFKSSHLGMGSFYLKPEAGKTYHAEMSVESLVKNYMLPLALADGIVISVDNSDSGFINFRFFDTDSLKKSGSDEYTIIGQVRGEVCFWTKINMAKRLVKIPRQIVPSGILQLTLFDKAMLPIRERLVFVDHHQVCDVKITSDRKTYNNREKVELDINAIDHIGNRLATNLSIAVFSNSFNTFKNINAPDILTNLLLTSDLKGNIENPGYYFQSDSVQAKNALDLLMMTQGWSRFIWKNIITGKGPEINYPMEHGINIGGKVRRLWVDKPAVGCKITLLLSDKNNQVFNGMYSQRINEEQKKGPIYLPLGQTNKLFETVSDSFGNFLFNNLYFTDSTKMIVQALNQKGKKNMILNLNEEPNSIVSIVPSGQINYSDKKANVRDDQNLMDQLKLSWLKKGDILLNEITITGQGKKGITPYDWYGEPDYTYDTGKNPVNSATIGQMLQAKIPGIFIDYSKDQLITLNRRGKSGTPLFLVDGHETDQYFVNGLPASVVDRIELLLDPSKTMMFSQRNGNIAGNEDPKISGNPEVGVILIYTKNGAGNTSIPDLNIVYRSPVGYSLSREFYSPKYDFQQDPEVQDKRSALYWAPYVFTDSTGMAKVVFYTNDVASKYIISVEGVTNDGVICKGNAIISVGKKE